MINGRFPDSALAPIAGGRLARAHALRWNMMNAAVRAAGLPTIMPTGPASSYRTFVQQVFQRSSWCARGRCGNAAVPGSSLHGLGRAVDTGRRAVAWAHGRRYGVRPPVDAYWEPWHALVHLDPVPRRRPSLEPVVRRGIVNRRAVSHLQRMLRKDGIKAPLNGRYDLATRRAVRRFQRAHHLKADGVVGPSTWRALHRAVDN
ncbi:MAG TPA: peptidoglycan-binding protein [Solirubrobacteraceae bacterium]